MSASLNRIFLIGNVGKDPEVRYLPSGDAVASFSLATSETWKDKISGDKQEKTEWHRIEVFGKLVDIVKQYVTKGSKLFVEGSMVYGEYVDKDGNKRHTASVKLGYSAKLILLGGGGTGTAKPRREEPVAQADGDEDVPF